MLTFTRMNSLLKPSTMSSESSPPVIVPTSPPPPARPSSCSTAGSFRSINTEPTGVGPMERPEFTSRASSPMTILGSEDGESDPVTSTANSAQEELVVHGKWSQLETVLLKVSFLLPSHYS